MKVLYDHQAFVLQSNGGISRYIVEVASRIKAFELAEVTVFGGLHVNNHLRYAENSISPLGFYFNRPWRGQRLINDLIWNLGSLSASADIYHATYYHPLTPPRGAKVFLTVHDLIDEKFRRDDPRYVSLLKRKSKVISDSDFILCNSYSTRRDLLDYYQVSAEKVGVTHLAASEVFRPARPDTERRNFLLFVGSRASYKNYTLLRQAYESFDFLYKDYEIVCFGGGPLVANEIPCRGVAKHMTGNDEDLARLYNEAAVFVYPSIYEGFGIPVLEALRCNCPVICGSTSSLPEVGGNFVNYFDCMSIESLAEVLESVLKLGNAATMNDGLFDWTNSFSWDACAKATTEFYRKALT
jgi:glycosyltransferase involved in cell wall biosynthesis